MPDPLDALPAEAREALRKRAFPEWREPMLATLVHDTFSDEGWIFERKLDGVRCLAYRRDGEVHVYSRNRKRGDDTWPEIVEALAHAGGGDWIVDGEIVAFEGNVTSFARLQQRLGRSDPEEARAKGIAVTYYVFDVLQVGEHDLSEVPLRHRKAVLKRLFDFQDPLRFTAHRNTEGEAFFREACEKGWEGLIAKDAASPYRSGRHRHWLKFKCHGEQEFVVGGFTDSKAGADRIGALLLGFYEDGALRYAGRVGTGFDDAQRKDFHDRLAAHGRQTCPFEESVSKGDAVHWTRPQMVVQVGFTEWTRDGKLRHPRFLGVRHDKDARDVHRD